MVWLWSRALFCPTAAIEKNCKGKVPRNHIYIQYILDICSTRLGPTLPCEYIQFGGMWEKHVHCLKTHWDENQSACVLGLAVWEVHFKKCSHGQSHQLNSNQRGFDLAVCHCCNCLQCLIILKQCLSLQSQMEQFFPPQRAGLHLKPQRCRIWWKPYSWSPWAVPRALVTPQLSLHSPLFSGHSEQQLQWGL